MRVDDEQIDLAYALEEITEEPYMGVEQIKKQLTLKSGSLTIVLCHACA